MSGVSFIPLESHFHLFLELLFPEGDDLLLILVFLGNRGGDAEFLQTLVYGLA